MTNITPTVGRIVWYFGAREGVPYTEPTAAIITKVWGDTCVNLAVFLADGTMGCKRDVYMAPPNTQAPSYPHAQWMPYQIGHADKLADLADEVMSIVKIKLANEYGIFPSYSKAGQDTTPPPKNTQKKNGWQSPPSNAQLKSHLRKVLEELEALDKALEKIGFKVEWIDGVV